MAKKLAKKAGKKVVKKSSSKGVSKVRAKSAVKKSTKPVSKTSAKKSAKALKVGASSKKAVIKKTGPFETAEKKTKSSDKAATSGKVAPTLKSLHSLKLQPLDNRIVIEIEEHSRTTPGGLFIPDTAQMGGHFKGRVIAVGSGHVSKKGKKRPLELKIGDQVLFSEWAGDKLEMNGKSVRILRESDVLGLVD